MLILAFEIAIGAIIQTAAYGVPQMYVGRIVAGLGTGMNTATAGVRKLTIVSHAADDADRTVGLAKRNV